MGNIELTQKQMALLEEFIKQFFTPIQNKRKNSGNELPSINSTLSRVFKKNFDFHLSESYIVEAFEKQGYERLFEKDTGLQNAFTFRGASHSGVYINIDTKIIRCLSRTTTKLPTSTNPEKREEVENMKEKILKFKNSQDFNIPEDRK
jgi:hypothetical protein